MTLMIYARRALVAGLLAGLCVLTGVASARGPTRSQASKPPPLVGVGSIDFMKVQGLPDALKERLVARGLKKPPANAKVPFYFEIQGIRVAYDVTLLVQRYPGSNSALGLASSSDGACKRVSVRLASCHWGVIKPGQKCHARVTINFPPGGLSVFNEKTKKVQGMYIGYAHLRARALWATRDPSHKMSTIDSPTLVFGYPVPAILLAETP